MHSSQTLRLLPPAASAPFSISDPQPQEFPCEVCGTIGREEFPGSDDYVDTDGDRLRDAQMAPLNAWVCCRRCLSQLMYQRATEEQQEALVRLSRALLTVAETVPEIETLLAAWVPEPVAKIANALFTVTRSAEIVEELLAVKQEPAWTNVPDIDRIPVEGVVRA